MKNTINKYFEVKVRLQKTMEDGQQKKVSEQYVVEAATFGEAERRIAECLKPYIEGEFEVTDIQDCWLRPDYQHQSGCRQVLQGQGKLCYFR